jgi:hypothetical protein
VGIAGALISVANGGLGALGVLLLWIGLIGSISKGHILVRIAGSVLLTIAIALTIGTLTRSLPTAPTTPGTSEPSTAEAARTESLPTDPMLAIVSSRVYEQSGYHFVEGQVTNLTAEPLDEVIAVATWYSQEGAVVTTGTALIEQDPILPGHTSPFKAGTRSNPAMNKYSVEFKLRGGTLAARDDSK